MSTRKEQQANDNKPGPASSGNFDFLPDTIDQTPAQVETVIPEVLKSQITPIGTSNKPDKQKRQYRKIDLSKAIVQRFQKHMTLEEIAKFYGTSRQAVHEALQPYEEMIQAGATVVDDNAMGALLQGAAVVHVLDSVRPKKREKMDGKAHAIAAAALVDKSRLYKGQSTSNQSILFRIVDEACKSRQVEAPSGQVGSQTGSQGAQDDDDME